MSSQFLKLWQVSKSAVRTILSRSSSRSTRGPQPYQFQPSIIRRSSGARARIRHGNSAGQSLSDSRGKHMSIELTMVTNDQQLQMSFDDVSQLYVGLLRILGLLPFKGRDYDCRCTRVLLGLFVITGVIDWSMVIGYAYSMVVQEKTLTVDMVCETAFVAGIHARYYVMLKRRAKLLAMVQECRAIWSECISERGHSTVCAFERQLRVLLVLLVGSYSFITVLFTANALLLRLPALEPNGTERRILPYKWYVLNAEEHWPGYWPTFFIQQLVVSCSLLITAGSDTASPFLMTIASGYFRHVTDYLYSTAQNSNSACSDDDHCEFIRHVKLHQRLLTYGTTDGKGCMSKINLRQFYACLRLCTELDRFGRIIFLIQLFSTGYNISLAGIMIIGSDPDKYNYVPVMAVCFYQLLLCQWAPDKLLNESSHIATAAYFSSVTWMKTRVGKLLVLVIARAQHPVQMTAGGVVNLSLERFGAMISSAVSFFMVLRNFDF